MILGGERVSVYATSMENKYHESRKEENLSEVVLSCESGHVVYAIALFVHQDVNTAGFSFLACE